MRSTSEGGQDPTTAQHTATPPGVFHSQGSHPNPRRTPAGPGSKSLPVFEWPSDGRTPTPVRGAPPPCDAARQQSAEGGARVEVATGNGLWGRYMGDACEHAGDEERGRGGQNGEVMEPQVTLPGLTSLTHQGLTFLNSEYFSVKLSLIFFMLLAQIESCSCMPPPPSPYPTPD